MFVVVKTMYHLERTDDKAQCYIFITKQLAERYVISEFEKLQRKLIRTHKIMQFYSRVGDAFRVEWNGKFTPFDNGIKFEIYEAKRLNK